MSAWGSMCMWVTDTAWQEHGMAGVARFCLLMWCILIHVYRKSLSNVLTQLWKQLLSSVICELTKVTLKNFIASVLLETGALISRLVTLLLVPISLARCSSVCVMDGPGIARGNQPQAFETEGVRVELFNSYLACGTVTCTYLGSTYTAVGQWSSWLTSQSWVPLGRNPRPGQPAPKACFNSLGPVLLAWSGCCRPDPTAASACRTCSVGTCNRSRSQFS